MSAAEATGKRTVFYGEKGGRGRIVRGFEGNSALCGYICKPAGGAGVKPLAAAAFFMRPDGKIPIVFDQPFKNQMERVVNQTAAGVLVSLKAGNYISGIVHIDFS